MSESLVVNDCLVHYDSRHIQVRRDFYDLCAYDKSQFNQKVNGKGKPVRDEPNQECMAKIIRVFETLTNDEKRHWYLRALEGTKKGLAMPPEPKEFPLQLAYSAICILLYNTYGESIVRNSIAVLLQRGYLKRYQDTINSIPCYVLNIDLLQQDLKKQAEATLLGVENNTQSTRSKRVLKVTAKPVKITASDVKVTPNAVFSTPPAVENNTNNKDKNTEKLKERKEEHIAPHGDEVVSSATPIVVASEPLSSLASDSQEDTLPKPSSKPGKQKTKSDQQPLLEISGPPVMPPPTARWCAETAVQIVEAKKGRRYSPTTRSQELQEAGKILKMEYKGQVMSRELFERAWDKMARWAFWNEKNIKPMIRHLRNDDKILSILEEMKASPQSITASASQEATGFKILKPVEAMKLSLAERKEYSRKLNEHLQAHPEDRQLLAVGA